MADINDVLAADRAAVLDLVTAAERSAATWTTPRVPGKWSPSQVVEHVARGLEEGAKANKALDPTSGPATPTEARVRLEGAFARFDQECRRRAASGQHVVSTGFGRVSVEDLVRFDALHTRHHCKQMPGAT